MINKIKKSDNRGSTMVLILVVIACIGIMAVVAIALSLGNFQMKKTDEGVKKSFYSAEGVLDEVSARLQEVVSDSYDIALRATLQAYTQITKRPDQNIEEARKEYFRGKYIGELKRRLGESDNPSDARYKLEKIQALVEPSLTNNIAENRFPYASFSYKGSAPAMEDNRAEDGLELKNLSLKFVDGKGFSSYIDTGILLKVPDVKFVDVAGIPDLSSFVLIGEKGVDVPNSGTLSIFGNAYAGTDDPLVANRTTVSPSFLVKGGAHVIVKTGHRIIANGRIDVASTSHFDMEERTSLWTGDIMVKGGETNFSGNTYVADDLTLDGMGSVVRFPITAGSESKYVGFGETDFSVSNGKAVSAIQVIGERSTLDMRGLKKLFIAGHSFIGNDFSRPQGLPNPSRNTDIRMGESISIKSNQEIYLVPEEWIGRKNGVPVIHASNPIVYKEYEEIANKGATEISPEIRGGFLNKSLKDILEEKYDPNTYMNYITKIFKPGIGGGQGSVYYFMNLPSDKAEKLFKEYYARDKGHRLPHGFYLSDVGFMRSGTGKVLSAGQYMTEQAGFNMKIGYTGLKTADSADFGLPKDYRDIYKALTSRLITDISNVDDTQKTKNVYQNIINEDHFAKLLPAGKSEVTVGSGSEKALIVKGNFVYDANKSDYKVIIASGDIEVKSDFRGFMIAKGKITVAGATKVEAIPKALFRNILKQEFSQTDKQEKVNHLYDIFADGVLLAGDENTGGPLADERNVKLGELVDYRNWSKH